MGPVPAVIRLLIVAVVAVPATTAYVLRILFAVFLRRPDASCVCEHVPKKWARVLLRVAGVRVVVENPEVVDHRVPQVLVANHVSWFDVLALTAYTPGRYAFVAKKEVRNVPLFGRAVEACGHIYIDRRDHQAALESLETARKTLAKDQPAIIMFPEGTRSEDGKLQPFKKGAFVLAIQAGADVVPTAILGSRAVMRKRSLLIYSGTITIRFGSPITTAGMGMEGRDELMKKTRDSLTRLLGAAADTN